MAFRVDSNGNRLNEMGQVIPTSEADKQRFKQAMQAAYEKNNPGATEVPYDQTVMIVEEGDNQWTIAEDAGADPATSAYQMNKQFENPDLIHPDDVVFLDKTTTFAATENPGGEPATNVGIFGDQIYSKVAKINTSDSGGTSDYDAVKADISGYLDSIPASQWNSTIDSLVFEYDWGAGHEGEYGRQLSMEAYLEKLPEGDRPAAIAHLEGLANQLPEGTEKTAILGDIRAADARVPG